MGIARGCTAQEGEESVMGVGQGRTSEGEAFLSRAEGEERSTMVGRGHTSQRESFLSRKKRVTMLFSMSFTVLLPILGFRKI
jgi:hypothetical protein